MSTPATVDERIKTQHPITDISIPLTGACLLVVGAVYIMFGFWTIVKGVTTGKSLLFVDNKIEPRWLLLPVALGVVGTVCTAIATFPPALAIGLVYAASDTVIAKADAYIFVVPMTLMVIFFAFSTVRQYTG